MVTTDFLKEAEVSSDLVRKFLKLEGKLKENEFENIIFEGVRIPMGFHSSISTPFLITQTPMQVADMNVGLFYGMQYDPRTNINDPRTGIKTTFFGDIFSYDKIKYSIVTPLSISHYSAKSTDKEIYKGFYQILGTEDGVLKEKGEVIMKRVNQE